MAADTAVVKSVRFLIEILNNDLGHTYKEIASQQQTISVASIKQFVHRKDVNFRADSNIVKSLSRYLVDHGSALRDQNNSKVNLALDLIEAAEYGSTDYDKVIVHTYSLIYKLLRIDYASEQFGSSMSRLSGCFVVKQENLKSSPTSALIIRRRSLFDDDSDVWEFVHVARISGEVRRSDGIAAALKTVLYLGGDIAEGSGVELFSISVPLNPSARVLSGHLMSIDDDTRPYTTKVSLVRVGERKEHKLFEDLEQEGLENQLTEFLESEDVNNSLAFLERRHNSE